MTAPYVVTISEASPAPNRALLDHLHTLVLAAALTLLCVTVARGESPWERLSRAITGKTEVQTAVAPAPSLAPRLPAIPDEHPMPTSGSLATAAAPQMTGLAVEGANGSEATLDLGRESDEANMMATDLFKKPEMRHLLGDEPRFIYNPGEKPDPMLVPWVRNAAIFSELDSEATAALKANDTAKAVALYQRVLALNDPRYSVLAQSKLMEINNAQAAEAAKSAQSTTLELAKIELPTWVAENTTGIIQGGGQNMALVGDDLVHAGDTLPKYPEIKVASITDQKVVYQIQSKTFEVELKRQD